MTAVEEKPPAGLESAPGRWRTSRPDHLPTPRPMRRTRCQTRLAAVLPADSGDRPGPVGTPRPASRHCAAPTPTGRVSCPPRLLSRLPGPTPASPRRHRSPCPGDACLGRRPPVPGSPGRGTACPQGCPRRSRGVYSQGPRPAAGGRSPTPCGFVQLLGLLRRTLLYSPDVVGAMIRSNASTASDTRSK